MFPPAYNVIRANKSKELGAVRLGGIYGLGRLIGTEKIGFSKGGLAVEGDARAFTVQNYHCAEKGLNMSLTIKKTDAGAYDDLNCISCERTHSFAERMAGDGAPMVIVLSDQEFPASLPASEGSCLMIMRVEDGTLFELEDAFTERFRPFLRPHGRLAAGSVIMIGSLSHLRARGLADFASSLVRVISTLSNVMDRH